MIAFDLQCSKGHLFEGWFEDGQAYKDQNAEGLITCPICNDNAVSKMLSTFAIKTSPKITPGKSIKPGIEKISKQIIEYVEKEFDHVGADFAKEALKIHYGVSEPRNIRGFSTEKEENTLKEEGIEFFKIPVPIPQNTDS